MTSPLPRFRPRAQSLSLFSVLALHLPLPAHWPRSRSLLRQLLALAVLAVPTALFLPTAGCRVDQADFNDRVFSCDVAAPEASCGTDESGRAMACFGARQIGATDFCAKTCDTGAAPPQNAVCLAAGISLQSCRPSDDADKTAHPINACDRRGLACYRTDLLADEGVCTTMRPCSDDLECTDPVRSVCATTFLAELYSQSKVLERDHLYCLQTGCKARGTSCSPGETCLQDVIPPSAHPADICVPNCDSQQRCPPNFLCYRKVSTKIAPNVCIPGLLGFTCDDTIDCMLGKCIDTGIGYKVCTTTCDTQADCQQFDGEQGKFVCIKNPANPTDPGYCQTPDAYRGSLCNQTADCIDRNPNEVCSRFDPKDPQGTCLLPCSADEKCTQRGGINHACLHTAVAGKLGAVCFPGYFGVPCDSDSNCVDNLTCRPTIPTEPSICTQTCAATTDCENNRWIGGDGWCQPDLKICLGKLDNDADCAVAESCKSGKCMANKCVAKGGGQ